MGSVDVHKRRPRSVWQLARRQHGVVTWTQLRTLGFSEQAIVHRVRRGRLHRVRHGVYAVGTPELTRHGQWMAAVLACGPGAILSHKCAAALWEIRACRPSDLVVSVPRHRRPRPRGIRVHRTTFAGTDLARRDRIPVTAPARTLIDLATCVDHRQLERAVNEADKLGLIDPERLRGVVDERVGARGSAALRTLLDRRTFALTDSELEREFMRLVRRAGLPRPETGVRLNGFKVDFFWPALGLVVETDGLRYHRTPAEQARDRRRDQAHARAGLTALRFTHAQVRFEPDGVAGTLTDVAALLAPPLFAAGSRRGRNRGA
ncbi:MAG: type IV toxin-antitoxin system AbiEi family antitoxin domain-containing protein [Solirubrobacterales bacterium]